MAISHFGLLSRKRVLHGIRTTESLPVFAYPSPPPSYLVTHYHISVFNLLHFAEITHYCVTFNKLSVISSSHTPVLLFYLPTVRLSSRSLFFGTLAL
jgi:hypothetical protein